MKLTSLFIFSVLILTSISAIAQDRQTYTTLFWNAPETRTDGSALPSSEIGGYRIYCGRSDSMTLFLDVPATQTTAEISSLALPDGLFECAVTAYNIYNVEGDTSETVPNDAPMILSSGVAYRMSSPGKPLSVGVR